MNLRLIGVGFTLFAAALGFAATPPVGFEDEAVLAEIEAGKIVVTTKIDTTTQQHSIFRAFFKGVTPEQYTELAIDHAKFPQMFPNDIKMAKTLKANADKTEFDYQLRIVAKVGPLEKKFDATLNQVVKPAADAVSETTIDQVITNYTDMISASHLRTRVIPWAGGVLVEDTMEYTLTNAATTGGALKKKLNSVFNTYTETFRNQLKGTP